ncbi:DUF1987 domain-containing protein [Desulfobacula toluolica]|uniref:Conserved uncharacterized protein n=1 Tax=Desulfobacula toluolica (strain DSM 7467 / Tol2) TaxID=651182 RepID=K0NF78_DESTT|nr:DUF1987 domain-containing protein [Desulfobacula toluolica]CCK79771.1 conserved uncharacterized protein [Desulfobacula toluolica Tol2]
MDTLYIEATKSSPFVKYNIESNTLEITGECYPENAVKFFSPVFEWLNTETKKLDTPVLTVNLNISYFNSSSSKALMNFFDMLEEAYDNGKKINVNWIYMEENETAEECGEEFQEDLETLPFNLVVLNSGQTI